MRRGKTHRGFSLIQFKDRYDAPCSLQKSSLATEDAIWLGVDDPDPKIMAKDTPQGGTGWVPYHIPDNVCLNTRMHLTREQARALAEELLYFAKTGDIKEA